MLSQLLGICQWPHGNSCTWVHDVRLYMMYIYTANCVYVYGYVKNKLVLVYFTSLEILQDFVRYNSN